MISYGQSEVEVKREFIFIGTPKDIFTIVDFASGKP